MSLRNAELPPRQRALNDIADRLELAALFVRDGADRAGIAIALLAVSGNDDSLASRDGVMFGLPEVLQSINTALADFHDAPRLVPVKTPSLLLVAKDA